MVLFILCFVGCAYSIWLTFLLPSPGIMHGKKKKVIILQEDLVARGNIISQHDTDCDTLMRLPSSLHLTSQVASQIVSVLLSVIHTSADIRASFVFIKTVCQSKLGSISHTPKGSDIIPKWAKLDLRGEKKSLISQWLVAFQNSILVDKTLSLSISFILLRRI